MEQNPYSSPETPPENLLNKASTPVNSVVRFIFKRPIGIWLLAPYFLLSVFSYVFSIIYWRYSLLSYLYQKEWIFLANLLILPLLPLAGYIYLFRQRKFAVPCYLIALLWNTANFLSIKNHLPLSYLGIGIQAAICWYCFHLMSKNKLA